jgi:hypothetical protein
MDIIKHLNDFDLSDEQKIFARAIRPRITSYSCREKIQNKEFIRKYFSPENDFCNYSTAIADPSRLIYKKVKWAG